MKWFYNLKVAVKLLIGFIIVAIITGIVGVFGIINMQNISSASASMYNDNTAPLNELYIITDRYQKVRVNLRELAFYSDTSIINSDIKNIAQYQTDMQKSLDIYLGNLDNQEEINDADTLKGYIQNDFNPYVKNIVDLYQSNRQSQIEPLLEGTGNTINQEMQTILEKMFNSKVSEGEDKANSNTTEASASTIIMIIIVAAAVIIAIFLGLFISRIISKPVKKMTKAAEKVAEGDLNVNIDIDSKDELGILAESMKNIIKNLQALISEMNHMSKEQDAGDIDIFVAEEKFQGTYKEMAKGVNVMVNSHLQAVLKVLGYINEFIKGNFNVEIEKFPGKKKIINENIEVLRGNLKDINVEINKLVNAANYGKLDERANTQAFHGDWAALMNGLNGLMDAILFPLNESMQVLGKMAFNDFTVEMTGQYKGKFKEFAEKINDVRDRLLSTQDAFERVGRGDASRLEELLKIGKRSENDKLIPALISGMQSIRNLIAEAGNLAGAAVNGDLSIRGNEDKFEGGYRDIIEGFNKTMDAVVQPIQEASAVMQEMSEGNLTVSMNGEYKGDYAKLKNDINSTIRSFNEVLNDINKAAQQVASGSSQVSDSSMALSQGATEQASSIEELTSSLEEISSQTKLNAENANQANVFVASAKSNAVQGNTHMREMLKAMEEINESSNNISKIIKVIDDIAFQTNILALNAAVEAARAGQHGKGFAVVAEEVRNLAARSAEAAKETTNMIEGSIKKVEDGTKIAKDTAEALNEIVDGVEKVASLVNDIAVASNEQASGIGQVNQGIMQVSQVVQTNSATSEESAAASEELSSQAAVLKEMVDKFKLNQVVKSYSNTDELNPEVIKMIERMIEEKKNRSTSLNGAYEETAITKSKIVLSDKEFGKY